MVILNFTKFYFVYFRKWNGLVMVMFSSLSLVVSSILFLAISKYPLSNSIPMKLRFVLRQATPVEPLPIKQSNTVLPLKVEAKIILSINFTGLIAGCNFFYFLYFHKFLPIYHPKHLLIFYIYF